MHERVGVPRIVLGQSRNELVRAVELSQTSEALGEPSKDVVFRDRLVLVRNGVELPDLLKEILEKGQYTEISVITDVIDNGFIHIPADTTIERLTTDGNIIGVKKGSPTQIDRLVIEDDFYVYGEGRKNVTRGRANSEPYSFLQYGLNISTLAKLRDQAQASYRGPGRIYFK